MTQISQWLELRTEVSDDWSQEGKFISFKWVQNQNSRSRTWDSKLKVERDSINERKRWVVEWVEVSSSKRIIIKVRTFTKTDWDSNSWSKVERRRIFKDCSSSKI